MGEVNGTVDAREKIEVYPPGRVLGNIQAPVISIESGVVFNGSCLMNARKIPPTDVTDTKVKTTIEVPKES
jgi:cytoskeletal protein CcmA (bactofilin family)